MNRKDSIKKMESYINEKYDDDFEYLEEFGGKAWGDNRQISILCKSKKYPEIPVTLIYDKKEEAYYDNYADVKYCKQADQSINDTLSEIFKNTRFHYEPYKDLISGGSASNFDADKPFEDYLLNRGITIIAYVDNTKQLPAQEIEDAFTQKLVNHMYCDMVNIYFLDNYTDDLETDYSIANKIVVNHEYTNQLSIRMRNAQKIESISWEK